MVDRIKFGRAWDIEIGPLRVFSTDGLGQGHRCVFEIDRDDSPIPNRASLAVYNLNPSERKQILDVGKRVPVRIQAGYRDGYQIIYQGDLLRSYVKQEGNDIVFAAQSGEGNEKVRSAQISRVFPKGTKIKDVILAIAEALEFDAVVDKTFAAVNGSLADSWTAHGDAAYELTALLKGFRCRWYVDAGRVVLLKTNESTTATGIKIQTLLTPAELHLVKDKATKKQIEVVRFTTILEPGLFPGAGIELDDGEGSGLSGGVALRGVKFKGDTHGTTWASECEGVFLTS